LSEQVRFKQTSETVCTDGRILDEIRERVPDCGAGDWEGTAVVSVETVAIEVLQVADGWRWCATTTATTTDHRPVVELVLRSPQHHLHRLSTDPTTAELSCVKPRTRPVSAPDCQSLLGAVPIHALRQPITIVPYMHPDSQLKLQINFSKNSQQSFVLIPICYWHRIFN